MKSKLNSWQATLGACCLAMVVQACSCNLTPILFIPLQEQYGLTYGQLGTLILINFITQVSCDILFSKAADKYGYRPFLVTAQGLCLGGFLLFAATPWIFPGAEYAGFVLATILFSGASGLCELLVSPLIDAIPLGNKATLMPFMHSFYAWGSVAVIAITTLLLFVCGRACWPFIVLGWALLPLVTGIMFTRVPMRSKAAEMKVLRIRELLRIPIFWVALIAIALGGAAEITMSQWTSAFMESVMGIDKATGDLLGMCAFAFMMGVGRMLYGKLGERFPLQKVLILSGFAAAACYLIVAFSEIGWLSLVACALCGFCVSLLWPGTLVIASDKLPTAGASMFALLAAGGDIGAAIFPSAAGYVAEASGLRFAFLIAAVIPLCCGLCHVLLARRVRT